MNMNIEFASRLANRRYEVLATRTLLHDAFSQKLLCCTSWSLSHHRAHCMVATTATDSFCSRNGSCTLTSCWQKWEENKSARWIRYSWLIQCTELLGIPKGTVAIQSKTEPQATNKNARKTITLLCVLQLVLHTIFGRWPVSFTEQCLRISAGTKRWNPPWSLCVWCRFFQVWSFF